MKRILQLADLHVTQYGTLAGMIVEHEGRNLFLWDVQAACKGLVDMAAGYGSLDGVVVTGDLFDRARPTPIEHAVAKAILQYAAATCDRHVLAFPGNHDTTQNAGDPSALSVLDGLDYVQVVERPEVVAYAGLPFGVIPFPRRGALRDWCAKHPESGLDPNDNAALSGILRSLALSLRAQGARVLAAHGGVEGATVGVQPRSLHGDVGFTRDVLEQFDAAMLGHIHQQQDFGPHVRFAGSPIICDYGEAGEPKGGILWTFADDGAFVGAERLTWHGREWDTWAADVEGPLAIATALEAVPPRAQVVRLRGALEQAALDEVRAAARRAVERGALVKDELEVLVPDRAPLVMEADEPLTEDEQIRRALGARGADDARQGALLTLHEEVKDDARQGALLTLHEEVKEVVL